MFVNFRWYRAWRFQFQQSIRRFYPLKSRIQDRRNHQFYIQISSWCIEKRKTFLRTVRCYWVINENDCRRRKRAIKAKIRSVKLRFILWNTWRFHCEKFLIPKKQIGLSTCWREIQRKLLPVFKEIDYHLFYCSISNAASTRISWLNSYR